MLAALWRMRQRESIAVDDQIAYTPIPSTTPMAIELTAEFNEEIGAESEQASDRPAT